MGDKKWRTSVVSQEGKPSSSMCYIILFSFVVQEIRGQIDELRQDMIAKMHGVANSGAILLGRIVAVDAESDAESANGKESIPFSGREDPNGPYMLSAFESVQKSMGGAREGLEACLVAGNGSPYFNRTRATAAEDNVMRYIAKFVTFLGRRSNAEKLEDVLIPPTEAKAGWLSESILTSLRADLGTARAGLESLGESRSRAAGILEGVLNLVLKPSSSIVEAAIDLADSTFLNGHAAGGAVFELLQLALKARKDISKIDARSRTEEYSLTCAAQGISTDITRDGRSILVRAIAHSEIALAGAARRRLSLEENVLSPTKLSVGSLSTFRVSLEERFSGSAPRMGSKKISPSQRGFDPIPVLDNPDECVGYSRYVLDVAVIQARDLPNTDHVGKTDAFVQLSLCSVYDQTTLLGAEKRLTSPVIDDCLEPVWHWSAPQLSVADPFVFNLHCVVMDEGQTHNTTIGKVDVSLASLQLGVVNDEWHAIENQRPKHSPRGADGVATRAKDEFKESRGRLRLKLALSKRDVP